MVAEMINVILAEDQGMLRGALGKLLSLEEDIHVIDQAENGEIALEKIKKYKPDICIMDIEMPVLTGLDAAEKVMSDNIPTKIIMLTTFARPGYFQRAMAAGVHGYLLKDSPTDDLANAIRKIYQGKRVISPELSFSVWDEDNPLSDREKEVLKLAADGLTSKEISEKLFLSNGTIRNYMSEILSKLDCKNRVEAISKAESKGWL